MGGIVFGFRRQTAAKIADLKDASTPVGAASFFDREAKAAEEQAERAVERQEEATKALPPLPTEATPEPEPSPQPEPSPPPPPTPPEEPASRKDEDAARTEALERSLREQLVKQELYVALSAAAHQLDEPPDFRAGELHELRNRVAHHEPLLTEDLRRKHTLLLELADLIEPSLAMHIKATTRVPVLIASRPDQVEDEEDQGHEQQHDDPQPDEAGR